MHSPWWYRRRDAVFGIIYAIGFTVGGVVSGALTGRYVPFFIDLGSRWGNAGIHAVIAVMLLLLLGCYALRLWGSSYLHAGIVWSDNSRTDSLVVAGPFRYVRNPLYFGNILMALGMGAFAPLAGWATISLLNVVFIAALIHWEERGLRERYGAQFSTYCKAVPALFPTLHPVPESGHVEPSIKQGLLAEIFVGSILLGMVALLTVKGGIGFAVFFGLYAVGMTLQRVAAGGGNSTSQVA